MISKMIPILIVSMYCKCSQKLILFDRPCLKSNGVTMAQQQTQIEVKGACLTGNEAIICAKHSAPKVFLCWLTDATK